MNKSLLKSTHFISGFIGTIIFCSFPSIKSSAQAEPVCYMIRKEGQLQKLDSICGAHGKVNIDSTKLRLVAPMVRKGREYMRAGQYQEAISTFTQAVNEYPNYAEAYMGRAYTKILQGIKGDSVIKDFQNAENAYRRRGQLDNADNISRLIQQYRREKLGSK